jgi:hypothetical protein
MKAPMTMEKYRGKLAKFHEFSGLKEGTMEERAKAFTERGKKEPDGVFVDVLWFARSRMEGLKVGRDMKNNSIYQTQS